MAFPNQQCVLATPAPSDIFRVVSFPCRDTLPLFHIKLLAATAKGGGGEGRVRQQHRQLHTSHISFVAVLCASALHLCVPVMSVDVLVLSYTYVLFIFIFVDFSLDIQFLGPQFQLMMIKFLGGGGG